MMYLGTQPVGLAMQHKNEVQIYSNTTFGNVWTEYQPTDVDFDNNAIVLNNTTNIPTNITNIGTALLILKPSLQLQYGTIPTELYKQTKIKNIGNNKVQFYTTDNTLITITDTNCLDLSKAKLLYRSSNAKPTLPVIDNFIDNHIIHIKLTYYGFIGGASGLQAFDSNGTTISGISYAVNQVRKNCSFIYTDANGNIYGGNDIDGYACIIGNRGLDYRCPLNNVSFGIYDLWFWNDDIIGGNQYEIAFTIQSVNTSNKTNTFKICQGHGIGYTNARIASIKYNVNSGSDWIASGSKLEAWDCGPIN